ncbi:uncharacterized protein LOC119741652 isoform X3 [Patiria miniata]|uniref:LRRNT domain-containing protein n=1 Tax=Patiria miniata TaxID=46514 RepID=A0A914BB36_PATMI|nr:uncharacterized protein LOC119741652 isoform X3 [Patiria miniata]
MAQFVVSFMRQRKTCLGSLGIFWSGMALLCSLSVCLAARGDEDACKICTCGETYVDCNGRNLTSVPSGIPQGTTSLKLKHNLLTNIKKDAFKNLTELLYLHLDDNQISYIQGGSFRHLNSLQVLILAKNRLKSLDSNTTEGLGVESSKLYISLEDNRLTHLSPYTFSRVDSPDGYINFSNNNISEIAPDAFLGVSSIAKIHLSINKISSLPEDLFDNITILRTLDLSNNNLSSFPAELLKSQHKLRYLYLQLNYINELRKGMFDGLHSLRELVIGFNMIHTIDDYVFSETPLVNLHLFHNNLTSHGLGEHPFATRNKSLQLVSLYRNFFDHIFHSAWQDLGQKCNVSLENTLKVVPFTRADLSIDLVGSWYASSIMVERFTGKSMNQSGFSCKDLEGVRNTFNCTSCSQGTYGGEFGGCKPCPPGGFYQDNTGSVANRHTGMNCKECNKGTYVPQNKHPGKTIGDCTVCPTGTNKSLHSGYRACPCASNHYRKHRFGQCFPCPKKGINCTGEYQHLLPGFWWTWDWGPAENYQSYKKFVGNVRTHNNSYDRHTEKFDGMLPKVHKCPTSESCKNLAAGINASCDDGHAGFLCTQCQAGSYAWLDKCFECPGIWALILEVLAALVILAVLLMIVLLELRRHKRSGRSLISVLFSRFKILLGFYQIMGEIFEVMNELSWPETLVELGSFLQLLEANLMQVIVSPRCYFPDFTYPNVYIAFIAGASFSVTVILLGLGIYGFRLFHLRVKSAPDEVRKHTMAKTNERILLAVVILLFVAYPSLSAVIISLLPSGCVTFSLNENENVTVTRLRSDYSVDCNSSQHVAFNYAAEVSVSYVVGFPTVLLIMLWLHRRRQASKKNGHQLETADIQAHSLVDQQSLLDTDDTGPSCSYHTASHADQTHPSDSLHTEDEEIAHIGDSLERLSSELPLEESIEVNSESITWVSFLDENYKEQYWYWEIVELARKVLQVLFVLLFGADDQFILFATIIVSVAFLIAHAYLKPMKDAAEHRIQMWSLTTIFLNLLAASLLVLPSEDGHTDDSDARKEFLAVFLVLLNISIFVIVAVSSIHVCLKVLSQTACCSYTAACFRHIRRCLAPSRHRTQEEHRDDSEPTTPLISGVPIEDRRNNNECRAV